MTDEIDTSNPERIWARVEPDWHEGITGENFVGGMFDAGYFRDGVPYVRADLYEDERQRAEKAEAENNRLSGRLCLTCGATFPASQSRSQPGKGCSEPHCCSIDMTLEEAFLHWRKAAHDRRVERDAEKAEVERLRDAALEVAAFRAQVTHGEFHRMSLVRALERLENVLRQDEGGEE